MGYIRHFQCVFVIDAVSNVTSMKIYLTEVANWGKQGEFKWIRIVRSPKNCIRILLPAVLCAHDYGTTLKHWSQSGMMPRGKPFN